MISQHTEQENPAEKRKVTVAKRIGPDLGMGVRPDFYCPFSLIEFKNSTSSLLSASLGIAP